MYKQTFKIISILFLVFTLFTACNKKVKYVEKSVNDQYEIFVPETMNAMEGLSAEASFQYGNELESFYVLVIDEPRDEFYAVFDEYELEAFFPRNLNGYTEMVVDNMKDNANIHNISEFENINVNGIEAIQTNFHGKYNGLDIYYHFTTLESNFNFYQIMSWTLIENKDLHEESMLKIARSFKEF